MVTRKCLVIDVNPDGRMDGRLCQVHLVTRIEEVSGQGLLYDGGASMPNLSLQSPKKNATQDGYQKLITMFVVDCHSIEPTMGVFARPQLPV